MSRILPSIALVAAVAQPAIAQGTVRSFVALLGTDTVAVEQFRREGNRITGQLVQRSPQTTVASYRVELGSDGRPTMYEYEVRRPDGSRPTPASGTLTVRFLGDSIHASVQRDTGAATVRRLAGGPAVLNVLNSMMTYDLAAAWLRAAGGDSVSVPVVGINITSPQGTVTRMPLVRMGRDSLRSVFFGNPSYLSVGGAGVTGYSGRATTLKSEIRAVSSIDVAGFVRASAARDAAGAGMGVAATRDTARGTVGRAVMHVDYGRPLLRGRSVWSNGVLGDTLWRTGANQATHFTTSADLEMDGRVIPAGTYTLWTRVSPDNRSYDLVVNRQTGQWGTAYDARQDLFRIPFTVKPATTAAERFTIAVEPAGAAAGFLVFHWGNQRLERAFIVR